MLKRIATTCFIVLAISFYSASASAQWTVHALAGTMRVVNVSSKTLIVETNDGTDGIFQLPKNDKLKLSFDKDVRAATIAPEKAASDAGQVIVFFFDDGDNTKTAVAVESIGTGTLSKTVGTVLSFNKHDHLLIVQTDTGAHQNFTITDKTIADTPDGVVPGRKFSAEPGEHVRLLTESKSGQEETLLIRCDGNHI
jgi:hypothetical protein